MKKAIMATLLGSVISAPVLAANSDDLPGADLVFNMDQNQSVRPAVLSSEEMNHTSGAYIYNVIGGGIGFITGNYTYLVNSAFDRNAQWSWMSYGRTVGASTVVGAISPVSSIRGAATAFGGSFISAWQFR